MAAAEAAEVGAGAAVAKGAPPPKPSKSPKPLLLVEPKSPKLLLAAGAVGAAPKSAPKEPLNALSKAATGGGAAAAAGVRGEAALPLLLGAASGP